MFDMKNENTNEKTRYGYRYIYIDRNDIKTKGGQRMRADQPASHPESKYGHGNGFRINKYAYGYARNFIDSLV
jgi:hypothetical protein